MFHWTKTRRLGGRFKYTLLNHDTSRCSWQSRWPLNKSYLKLFDFFQVISKLYQVQISIRFITEHKVLFCASTLYHLSVSVLRWHIWWFVSNFPKLSDKFQNCFHRVHYIQHLMMDIWCRAKSVSSPSLALATRKLDTERGISHPGSKGWNVFDICLVLVRSVWWGRVSGDECTEGKFDVPGGPGHDTTDNGDTVVTSSHRGGKRGIGDNTDTSHYRDVFPSVILTTVTWSKSPLRIINMDLRRLIDNLPRLQYVFLPESTL